MPQNVNQHAVSASMFFVLQLRPKRVLRVFVGDVVRQDMKESITVAEWEMEAGG